MIQILNFLPYAMSLQCIVDECQSSPFCLRGISLWINNENLVRFRRVLNPMSDLRAIYLWYEWTSLYIGAWNRMGNLQLQDLQKRIETLCWTKDEMPDEDSNALIRFPVSAFHKMVDIEIRLWCSRFRSSQESKVRILTTKQDSSRKSTKANRNVKLANLTFLVEHFCAVEQAQTLYMCASCHPKGWSKLHGWASVWSSMAWCLQDTV